MSTPQKHTWEIAKTLAHISKTKDEIAHWKREQITRENHFDRIDAGARVLLWESQLRVLEGKLSALQSNLQPAHV